MHIATRDAFPEPNRAKEYIIAGIVRQIFKQFKENHLKLEDRVFPRYEQELYTLVGFLFLLNSILIAC